MDGFGGAHVLDEGDGLLREISRKASLGKVLVRIGEHEERTLVGMAVQTKQWRPPFRAEVLGLVHHHGLVPRPEDIRSRGQHDGKVVVGGHVPGRGDLRLTRFAQPGLGSHPCAETADIIDIDPPHGADRRLEVRGQPFVDAGQQRSPATGGELPGQLDGEHRLARSRGSDDGGASKMRDEREHVGLVVR